jgi:hypothetical protein
MLVMNQLRGHINQLFILIKMLVESVFSLLFDGYFTLGAPPAVGRFLPGIRQDQSSDVCKVEASLPADAKGLMEMEQNASWPHGCGSKWKTINGTTDVKV